MEAVLDKLNSLVFGAKIDAAMPGEGFVTAQEAADVLGLDVSQVRRLCRDGLIKGAEKFAETVWMIPRASLADVRRNPTGRPRKNKPVEKSGKM